MKFRHLSQPRKQLSKYENQKIVAGIDIGLVSSKAVIMVDNEIFAHRLLQTEAGGLGSAQKVLDRALNGTGMTKDDIHYIVGTGCREVDISVVKKRVSEVACHARGVNYSLGPSIRTILVMGGQDCAAVHCDEKAKVTAFLMNACRPVECPKTSCFHCGTAQGWGMEEIASSVGIPIEEIGAISLSINEEQLKRHLTFSYFEDGAEFLLPLSTVINNVCAILAKSQVIWLLSKGWSKAEILAAYCATIAHEGSLLLERLGVIKELAVTGGVAKNLGVVQRLKKELNTEIFLPKLDPQLTGALGAALFARDFLVKQLL